MYKLLTALFFSMILVGCQSLNVDDYQAKGPQFAMDTFFEGKLVAKGVVQDRSGKVLRRFKADLVGTWKGNEGLLEEVFYWDDGEIQYRNWKLKKGSNGIVSGTAEDVVGVANGRSSGNALNWYYTLAVPLDGETWNFYMDDWMYLLDEDTLFNQTEMTKFGLTVGEINIFIYKVKT